jgi:MFS transporter, DHA2 family, multidrug resistance protein
MVTARGQRAGLREWLGLLALTGPPLLIGLDFTVLHLVLPHLAEGLRPSNVEMLWIVDIYGFFVAGMLIPMGALGDRIGRRRLLLIGAVLFAGASMVTAFSSTPAMVIASRALLGLTAATLLPATLSLVTNLFHDDNQRRLAIAVWSTAFSVGNAAGPVVGGALLEHFWWGSVFLLALPVMAMQLVLIPLLVPEYRDREAVGVIDMTSVGLLLVSLLAIVYGVKELARGSAPLQSVAAVIVGLAIGVVFLRRQRRLADPLLDLALFARRRFTVALSSQFVSLFTLAAFQFFLMQYLQLVLGLGPLTAGLWTLPGMLAGIVGALLGPVLTRHITPPRVIAGGLVLTAASLVVAIWTVHGLIPIVITFTVMNLGINIVWALSYDQILAEAPPERAGASRNRIGSRRDQQRAQRRARSRVAGQPWRRRLHGFGHRFASGGAPPAGRRHRRRLPVRRCRPGRAATRRHRQPGARCRPQRLHRRHGGSVRAARPPAGPRRDRRCRPATRPALAGLTSGRRRSDTHRRRLRCEEQASKPRPPLAPVSRLASSHLNLRGNQTRQNHSGSAFISEFSGLSGAGKGLWKVKAHDVGPCPRRWSSRCSASTTVGRWPAGTHHRTW